MAGMASVWACMANGLDFPAIIDRCEEMSQKEMSQTRQFGSWQMCLGLEGIPTPYLSILRVRRTNEDIDEDTDALEAEVGTTGMSGVTRQWPMKWDGWGIT